VGKVERDRKIQERSAAQLPSQRLMKKTYVDGLDARIAASGSCIEFDITFLLVLCYRCIVQSMLVTRMSIICASGIVSMKMKFCCVDGEHIWWPPFKFLTSCV
jgi:hypothetical protein